MYSLNHNSLGCSHISHRPRCNNGSHHMYRTHRVAVSHSLDLVVVLALGQSVQPLWVELTTRGVELLAVVHRQFSAE